MTSQKLSKFAFRKSGMDRPMSQRTPRLMTVSEHTCATNGRILSSLKSTYVVIPTAKDKCFMIKNSTNGKTDTTSDQYFLKSNITVYHLACEINNNNYLPHSVNLILFCFLSSWFTSSRAYHLITTFALTSHRLLLLGLSFQT